MNNERSEFEAFVLGMVRDLRMRFVDAIIPTTAEYAVKVLMMDSLLKGGYVLREAGQSKDKLIGIARGKLRRQMVPKVGARGTTGFEKKQLADVRVEWPLTCDICLKAASQHGSQEYLYAGRGSFKHGVGPDLDHIRNSSADLFVLAADLKCYETLRGDRGSASRRATGLDEMIELLPPAADLPLEPLVEEHALTRGRFRLHGTVVTSMSGVRRVILAVWGEDAIRRASGFRSWGDDSLEVLG